MQVEARDVNRSYGDETAVDGVSLSVGAGEVFALVGPNGAGKTTLVKCLTGVLEPDSGETRLGGVQSRKFDRNRLGVLPQEFTPPERLSVKELVEYYGSLYSDTLDYDDVISQLGLGDCVGDRYRNLSGGQKRRLCVATAIVNDPDVLFLDEPTTGIDPAGRKELWNYISGLSEKDTAVFLTTHYMEEAEVLADRVGLMADGRLVEVGEPEELVEKHAPDPELVVEYTDSDVGDVVDLLSRHFDSGVPESEIKFEHGDGDVTFQVVGDVVVFNDVSAGEIGGIVDVLGETDLEYGEIVWRQPGLSEVYVRLVEEIGMSNSIDNTSKTEPETDGSGINGSETSETGGVRGSEPGGFRGSGLRGGDRE
ncbi:MAG: ABC transporter ATP-binding protein [Halobacteria archaeon]